jgi:hypothetical protein
MASAAVFLAGMMVGHLPREIGKRVDPHDAYPSQFAATFQRSAILEHTRLLAMDCLPRLIAGADLHRFGHQLVRDGVSSGRSLTARSGGRDRFVRLRMDEWLAVLLGAGFAAAVGRLTLDAAKAREPARKAIGRATVLSALLIVAAFLVNRNIFNSDNYRYLIFLLTPWSLGFGLLMKDLAQWRLPGRLSARLIVGLLAVVMTADMFHWYRDTRHYLDDRGFLIRSRRPPWSELVIQSHRPLPGEFRPRMPWTYTIPPDVTHVFGGYWDVYRLAFLAGKRVVGIPYPTYPNRFSSWSEGLGPDHGRLLILRPGEPTKAGLRPAAEMPGGRGIILGSATRIDWRPALTTVWKADGRDLAELDRLQIVVP